MPKMTKDSNFSAPQIRTMTNTETVLTNQPKQEKEKVTKNYNRQRFKQKKTPGQRGREKEEGSEGLLLREDEEER